MSEIVKDDQEHYTASDLGEVLTRIIREAIKQELKDSTGRGPMDEVDCLLTVEQVAETLNVSPDWVYDNARRLPFTRKLGPKMLRFSRKGLQKYQEAMREGY
jgi:excisionase family DNA binding protein